MYNNLEAAGFLLEFAIKSVTVTHKHNVLKQHNVYFTCVKVTPTKHSQQQLDQPLLVVGEHQTCTAIRTNIRPILLAEQNCFRNICSNFTSVWV